LARLSFWLFMGWSQDVDGLSNEDTRSNFGRHCTATLSGAAL
jgi:hypothetical protein